MERVAAIVPTYNRYQMLRESLSSLLQQTRPLDKIYVVDNGNSKECQAMIEKEFCSINYLPLNVNSGSAGGFRAGMEQAYKEGYDWIWLADDDAFPALDALELLLVASRVTKHKVFNSLVVNPDGQKINWNYQLYLGDTYCKGYRTISNVSELLSLNKPFVNGLAQFNTGSLIHRQVIDMVGFHCQGLFIRGEEVDYVLRIQKAGFKTITVVASRYFHPAEPVKYFNFLGHKVLVPVMSPEKQYYCLRNELINARKYNFTQELLIWVYIRAILRHNRNALVIRDKYMKRLYYLFLAAVDGLLNRVYMKDFGE